MKRCFIYAHYDTDEEIKDYVFDELSFLSKLGDIIFISDNNLDWRLSQLDIYNRCLYKQAYRHGLYDVYSYNSGFKWLYDNNLLKNYDCVYFVNNSILFPNCNEKIFIESLEEIENNNSSAWGMCKSHWLIQSYWIGIRNTIYPQVKKFFDNYSFCTEDNLNAWWEKNKDVKMVKEFYKRRISSMNDLHTKKWVHTIMNFERGFSRYLIDLGYDLPCINDGGWPASKVLTKVHTVIKPKPLVSIVMTLYDIRRDFLLTAIMSILKQTYKNIEIICIDDASPAIRYNDLAAINPKIRLIRNETNLGLSKSVNKAFRLVNGRYIMRMGSDDILDQTYISKAVDILENDPETIAVACDLKRFGFATNLIERPDNWDLYDILYNQGYLGCGYAGGVVFRSSVLAHIEIDESFEICEDFDFHLSLLERERGKIRSIHEPAYLYRSHETNITKQVKKEDRWKIMHRILEKHRKIYQQLKTNSEID